MSTHRRLLSKVLLPMVTLLWVATAPQSWADNEGPEIPFSKAKLIIEYNNTAQDVGMQVLLDGEPWKKVVILRPDGLKILDIVTRSSLRMQGLTELFFESSEPSLADVPLAEFLRRFPEGEYEFEGETVDGLKIEGEAILTHVIPAGPVILSPVPSHGNPPVVNPNNFFIAWKPVKKTITGSSNIAIVGYQVIVEQPTPLRTLLMDLPALTTRVKIPPEFFQQRNALHKFEVLAIEAGGNQTITSGEFVTAP